MNNLPGTTEVVLEKKPGTTARQWLARFFYSQTMLLVFVVLFVVASVTSPDFLKLQNLSNIIQQNAVVGILACGMTIVVIGKGIDLSAASILALCAVANLELQGFGYFTAVLAAILVGIACGAINGYLIGKIGANFVVATLGTQVFFTAIALITSGGNNMRNRSGAAFSFIGSQKVLGVPVIGLVLLVTFVVLGFILHRTIPGRRIFATGLNDRAARVAGINTRNVIFATYVINGLVCAIASIALASRLPRVRVGTAADYLYDVITVVVLGGTALTGGIGGIHKTLIGLGILAIVKNDMSLLHVPYQYQQMIEGIVLVVAVLYDRLMTDRRLRVSV